MTDYNQADHPSYMQARFLLLHAPNSPCCPNCNEMCPSDTEGHISEVIFEVTTNRHSNIVSSSNRRKTSKQGQARYAVLDRIGQGAVGVLAPHGLEKRREFTGSRRQSTHFSMHRRALPPPAARPRSCSAPARSRTDSRRSYL